MAEPIRPASQADLRTLDSKISLIAQKLLTMERNQEVIGRTLVALNDKIRKVEEKTAGGAASAAHAGVEAAQSGDIDSIKQQLKVMEDKLATAVTKEELMEVKYVVDTINPLEYATIDQVKDLLDERIGKKK